MRATPHLRRTVRSIDAPEIFHLVGLWRFSTEALDVGCQPGYIGVDRSQNLPRRRRGGRHLIGISGIYPKAIDEAWVESAAGTDPPKMSPASADATSKPLGIVATIPLPPHRAITAGQATV